MSGSAASNDQRYWEPPRPGDEDSAMVGYDDENKHYVPVKGEVINGRYKTVEVLGKGTFGRVLSCLDLKTKKDVAVKIIRSIPKYTRAGQIEVQILQRVKRNPYAVGYDNVVTISDTFYYRDHICMVFPKYGCSLLDLLRYNRFNGFNLDWTRELSRSFLTGVLCLHKNSLVHTDIKPENILTLEPPIATRVRDRVFVHPPGADLVVIDLGSSVPTNPIAPFGYNDENNENGNANGTLGGTSSSSSSSSRNLTNDHIPIYRPVLICTRQYRPPEIILGCATEPIPGMMIPSSSLMLMGVSGINGNGTNMMYNSYGASSGLSGYNGYAPQTTQYPPPIIPYPWDKTVDVFSCGCVIYEILTGRTLFRTHDSLCHLAQMTKILGNPPKEIVQYIRQRIIECNGGVFGPNGYIIPPTLQQQQQQGSYSSNNNNNSMNGMSDIGNNNNNKNNSCTINSLLQITPAVVKTYPILRYFNGKGFDLPADASEDETRHYNESVPLRDAILPISSTLYDLLRRMLSWLPPKRGSIAECLRHPFMREEQKETRTVQTDISCVGTDTAGLSSAQSESAQLTNLRNENNMLKKQLEQMKNKLMMLQNENV